MTKNELTRAGTTTQPLQLKTTSALIPKPEPTSTTTPSSTRTSTPSQNTPLTTSTTKSQSLSKTLTQTPLTNYLIKVMNYYNNLAKIYDKLYLREQIPKYLLILEKVKVRGRRVIDIGSGTGTLALIAAPVAKYVLCLDISRNMLEIAKQKLRHHSNVDLLQATMTKIPIRKKTFNTLTAVTVMTIELMNYLDEVLNLVREGAEIAITVPKSTSNLAVEVATKLLVHRYRVEVIDDDSKDYIIIARTS